MALEDARMQTSANCNRSAPRHRFLEDTIPSTVISCVAGQWSSRVPKVTESLLKKLIVLGVRGDVHEGTSTGPEAESYESCEETSRTLSCTEVPGMFFGLVRLRGGQHLTKGQ